MSRRQKLAAVLLVVLLTAAAYGLFRTNQPAGQPTSSSDKNPNAQNSVVDQTPLTTAQRLALLASGEDEQALAQEALRLADHEVDLAFAAALRSAAEHPPVLGPEARELQTHLVESESALENDKAQIARLTAEELKAEGERKLSIADELEIAKAQLELGQDEVEDAKQDLMRAGGDPQGRIQAMVQEHEATLHDAPTATNSNVNSVPPGGLVHRMQQWSALRQRNARLTQAQHDAMAAASSISAKHNSLVAQLGAKKASVGVARDVAGLTEEPKEHSTGPRATVTKPRVRNHEEAKVVVKVTKERSAQQNELATFDKRIEAYTDLAVVYEKWSTVVSGKQRSTLRLAIWGFTVILFILLIGLFFTRWLESLLGKLPLARRQLGTLRAVTRVALQILALLLMLVVIFGPPTELGTFLGLAGAGLTIALKDFIVSFVGWFVLMGRNGIRLGDWVEINGVSGEVVELGMFHTVLLETGNWTDSGHPTGRRVTFTNSFAIEGHYFNFSTSGQWLWDELQIVLPAGKDPFPIVDAVQKKVLEATSESAGLAEQEWQRAARSRDMSALSAAPAINVRPVLGGIEMAVRYITRANERYQLRAKLYHVAMDLLATKNPAAGEVASLRSEKSLSGSTPAGVTLESGAVKVGMPGTPEVVTKS
jgi:small-conductance mechanosensitive channel